MTDSFLSEARLVNTIVKPKQSSSYSKFIKVARTDNKDLVASINKILEVKDKCAKM